ncbi:hypothetical protein, partial [Arthrobacter cupressi]
MVNRPQIEVTTTTRNANDICRNWFMAANGPPLDHGHLQRLHDILDRLPRLSMSIRIDGTSANVTLRETEDALLAAGNHSGLGIALVAQGPGRPAPEGAALESVADIEPLQAARRTWLRKARGEYQGRRCHVLAGRAAAPDARPPSKSRECCGVGRQVAAAPALSAGPALAGGGRTK